MNNRLLWHRSTSCIPFVLLAGMFCIVTAPQVYAAATQPHQPPSKQQPPPTLAKTLQAISQNLKDPSLPYNAQLLFFGQYVNDPGIGGANIEKWLEKVDSIGSKASLPALVSILNKKQFWFRTGELWGSWPAIRPLATKAWYDIKWKGADQKTRMITALYGMNPDAPVRVRQTESYKRLLKIGSPARPRVYDILLHSQSPFTTSNSANWIGFAEMEASSILAQKPFRPTRKEFDDIVINGGPFGRMAMIDYALIHQHDWPVFKAMVDMIHDYKHHPAALYDLMVSASREFKDVPLKRKLPLIKAIVEIGHITQSKLLEGTYNYDWINLIPGVTYALRELGPSPTGQAYFRQYLAFRQNLDAKILNKKVNIYKMPQSHITALQLLQGVIEGADLDAHAALSNKGSSN